MYLNAYEYEYILPRPATDLRGADIQGDDEGHPFFHGVVSCTRHRQFQPLRRQSLCWSQGPSSQQGLSSNANGGVTLQEVEQT